MIGLGLALAQPKLPVVVITGDGEMLMGMGSLATVGLQKPGNLSIVVLDNEALRRDRRTGQPYCRAGRSRRRRQGLRHRRQPGDDDHGRGRGVCARRCRTSAAGRGSPASRSTAPIWSGCCPAADGTFIVNRIRGSLGYQPI